MWVKTFSLSMEQRDFHLITSSISSKNTSWPSCLCWIIFLKNPGGHTASLCHAILDGTYNTSGPQFHELSYKGEHFPCQLLSSRRDKIHKCILRTLQLSNQEPERSFTDLLRTVTTLSMSQFKFSSFYFRQLVYLVSLWFCLFVLSLNNIFKDEVYKYAYYYKRNYFLS